MSSGPYSPSITQDTYCHISARLDSSAPLGRDSVPEVNIIRTGSSSSIGTSGGVPSWSSHSSRSSQPSGAGSPFSRTSAPHRHRALRGGGQRPVGRLDERVLDHERPRAAVVEDEGDLVAVEHEVDRHQHHTGPGGGEVEDRELPAVVAQQRQPVALAQPGVGQRRRDPVDGRVELGEGQPGPAVDDRELVGCAARGTPGQVAERVPAGGAHEVRGLHAPKLRGVDRPDGMSLAEATVADSTWPRTTHDASRPSWA